MTESTIEVHLPSGAGGDEGRDTMQYYYITSPEQTSVSITSSLELISMRKCIESNARTQQHAPQIFDLPRSVVCLRLPFKECNARNISLFLIATKRTQFTQFASLIKA